MKNSKINRRLKSLWYKKDLVGWIDFKVKVGKYPINVNTVSIEFKRDMSIWNKRFIHKDFQHYENWQPYCCNDITACSSSAFDRMSRTVYGWRCKKCDLIIGKHLRRINAFTEYTIKGWSNKEGRPRCLIQGDEDNNKIHFPLENLFDNDDIYVGVDKGVDKSMIINTLYVKRPDMFTIVNI